MASEKNTAAKKSSWFRIFKATGILQHTEFAGSIDHYGMWYESGNDHRRYRYLCRWCGSTGQHVLCRLS